MIEVYVFFLTGLAIIATRGMSSTDFLFYLFTALYHVPLAFAVFSGQFAWFYVSDVAVRLAFVGCSMSAAAFLLGGMLRRSITKRPEQLTEFLVFRNSFHWLTVILGLLVFVIGVYRLYLNRSGGYAANLGSALIQPTADWLLMNAYLVIIGLRIFTRQGGTRPLVVAKLLLPFVPFLLAGSRQAFLGPLLAITLMLAFSQISNSFGPFGWKKLFKYILISVFLLLGVGVFTLIRTNRIQQTENVLWGNEGGVSGLLLETGLTIRIVDWALSTCAGAYSPFAYVTEALLRLIPLYGEGMQNLSLVVAGRGNAFSLVAEGVCLGGEQGAFWWSAVVGLFIGFCFSENWYRCRDGIARVRTFTFISLAVMWPRDELLGYVRELVWTCLLFPWLFSRVFARANARMHRIAALRSHAIARH